MDNKILSIFAIEKSIKELCLGIFVIWSNYVECPLALVLALQQNALPGCQYSAYVESR